jgi:polyphosphate glucokinase
MDFIGLDIGGSGIKAAVVDTETGRLVTDRVRLKTPEGAEPAAVADTAVEVIKHFDYRGPVGCGFPALMKAECALTATNIHKTWIGQSPSKLISERTGLPVFSMNDADAAGLAEVRFGAGAKRDGVIFVITLGTGLGSALFVNGQLVPNTELGHLYMSNGEIAEKTAAESARKRNDWSWDQWGKRVNAYLEELDKLFSPDLVILGGGASKNFDKFKKRLTTKIEVVPARLLNLAGIIGAAMHAREMTEKRRLIQA